jgi:hypothetical protein
MQTVRRFRKTAYSTQAGCWSLLFTARRGWPRRQGHFFISFAFFTADFFSPLPAREPFESQAAPSLALRRSFPLQDRPRRTVIGHVLLHGHSRNGAADDVESHVVQRFEADATFARVQLLAALFVFAGEAGAESG